MNTEIVNAPQVHFQSLEELGFEGKELVLLKGSMSQPVGLVLIAGITGARYDETINACVLHATNSFARKVAMVEQDDLDDLSDIDPSTGLPKPKRLKLMLALRNDPDLFIAGEARTQQSAEFVMHCALAGYKVITKIHAASSLKTITRLVRLGANPDHLRTPHTISALVYQASLPALCPHCSVNFSEAKANQKQVWESHQLRRFENFIEPGLLEQLRFRGTEGCDQCHGGVSGRTLATEVVVPDDRLFDLMLNDAHDDALDYFRKQGGKTAFDNALIKAFRGEIDLREVEVRIDLLSHYIVRDGDGIRAQYEYPPEFMVDGATAVPVIRPEETI